MVDTFKYLKHPASVSIETYCYCNAKCIFCSFDSSKRKCGKMSAELFHKIIDEISSWNIKVVINLSVFGEPFLNPDWLYLFKYIEKKCPLCKISVATNGSMITDNVIDEIVKLKNIEVFGFSLYAYHDDTYHDIMGLPPNTIRIIEHAIERISNENKSIFPAISYSPDPMIMSGRELELFKKKWGKYAYEHRMVQNHQHTKIFDCDISDAPCLTMFSNLSILHDGRVSLCCFDANGEIILGDVKTQSLLDVWNCDLYNDLRYLHVNNQRSQIPLCGSCNYGYPFKQPC